MSGIRSHMGDMSAAQLTKGRREGIFAYSDSIYDSDTDTYTCPAGLTLRRCKHKKTRKAYEYACLARCARPAHFAINAQEPRPPLARSNGTITKRLSMRGAPSLIRQWPRRIACEDRGSWKAASPTRRTTTALSTHGGDDFGAREFRTTSSPPRMCAFFSATRHKSGRASSRSRV